jgi:PmbA protein
MSTNTLLQTDLHLLARTVLDRAMKAGATDAEAVAYEGEDFSATVRLGQVETLKESGARAIGLRVFNGLRTASTSSSDLTPDGLAKLVEGAIALAKITSEDPFVGLPESSELAHPTEASVEALGLYFADVHHQPPAERIEIARRCEAAAMAFDTRIQNSGGGDFDTSTTHKVMVNSRGFEGEYRRSYCGFSAAPIAQDDRGRMQRNYWYSSARTTRLLEDPEAIGIIAAQRTLRRLGARRVETQRAPVVFAPETARSLIGNIFDAANGDAIYRHASFLDGMLNERIAGENITIVNDGTMVFPKQTADGETLHVGGFGTAPFDGEGLPTRRTVLVKEGVLRSYVTNTYTGRKLGIASTGNASRSLAGNPGIGAGNFYLEPGSLTPEQLLAPIRSGLYVTETMGFGVNLVTGDYSQGASGLWIENGELAYPVEEITIAGNLKDMYRNIVAIGNDLVFRGASASPTIHVEGMTIAGS